MSHTHFGIYVHTCVGYLGLKKNRFHKTCSTIMNQLDLHPCVALVGSDVISNTMSWFTIYKNINVVVHIELIVGEKQKQQKKTFKI